MYDLASVGEVSLYTWDGAIPTEERGMHLVLDWQYIPVV